jgi:TolB-like protein/tRNA A-37 threonylcarbamoyl transferase component Bud32/Tfp pilus assembly protein PilF
MATGAAREVCESCGATLHAESPGGLCPACLLTTAIEEGDLEEPISGSRIQDYDLLNEVARGGMGIVYRARQRMPPRIVALKMILPANVGSAEALKRFRAEAEAAASLEHEGILPIYAVGEHDGAPFYSMKFAEGGTLSARIERYRDKPREAAALIAKLARAVAFAHEKGILHRDLKPANVLFDSVEKPYVSDFGLAKWIAREGDLTQTFAVLGTPFYMAPEQAISSQMVSATADVYSLGAILFHLLTGQPPFTGDTPMEVLHRAENQPAPRPRLTNRNIPPDLETICLKCLEKDPAWRYPSAAALSNDLDRFCTGRTIQARRTGVFARAGKWVQRKPAVAALIASLLALAAAVGWNVWKSELIRQPITGIAVLPFENLSDEKEHAFFADGVQDDILTKLAKIADLKVISRTSVMQYRGKQNVREIGDALRVSHVLEGTVRRSAGKVHINAQLIDTRSDTHVWAEQYNRDLNDVFAIESEVAQSIANRLGAKVSAREKAAMQEWPTRDLVAYDLYTRANDIISATQANQRDLEDSAQAIDLLNRVVARDPSFLQAYCKLAFAHDALYWWEFDHTPARLAMAEAAVQEAFRIRPNAGETRYARAVHLYRGYRDFDGALAELEVAHQTLPNHAPIFAMMGYIQRRQGRWEESTQNLERAAELDPRDIGALEEVAFNYGLLNRYTEAKSWHAREAALAGPDDVLRKLRLSWLEFIEKADTRPVHQAIDSIRATNPAAVKGDIALDWLICTLAERDAAAATEALSALGDRHILREGDHIYFPRAFVEGLIARMTNDEHKAQLAFTSARAEQEKIVQAQPDYPFPLCVLGVIDAFLGRKEEALREGQRAVELLPVEKDAIDGKSLIKYLAIIAAWIDEKDLACEQLALVTGPTGAVGYGGLKLFPWWDPLRGEPCFEKIVASLAPKEIVISD